MFPLKKILWPTDFSEPSYEALEAAVAMAEAFRAELHLLHVIPPIPALVGPEIPSSFEVGRYQAELEKSAEKMMNDVREKKAPKSVKVHTAILQGNPPQEIARFAEEKHIDLIVIATHGETGWKHFLFGSVAEKVMRHALVPVLIIHARHARK